MNSILINSTVCGCPMIPMPCSQHVPPSHILFSASLPKPLVFSASNSAFHLVRTPSYFSSLAFTLSIHFLVGFVSSLIKYLRFSDLPPFVCFIFVCCSSNSSFTFLALRQIWIRWVGPDFTCTFAVVHSQWDSLFLYFI